MPLPVLAKTWQFSLNNRVFADSGGRTDNEDFGNDQRNLFYGIKEAMKNFASNPWVTVGSSDFVASNMTGTDLITDPITDLRCSQIGLAQAHSWWVGEQVNVGGSGLSVLFNHECANGGDGGTFDVFISEVGFGVANGGTDGSITARPTATDEVQINSGNTFGIEGNWGSGDSATGGRNVMFNVMQSTDGECTRVVTLINNNPVGFWFFDTIQNPVVGWGEKFVCGVLQNGNSNSDRTPDYDVLNTGTARLRSIRTGLGGVRLYMTGEGLTSNSDMIGEQTLLQRGVNQINQEFHLSPPGVASLQSGFRGRHGQMFDLWWAPELRPDGSAYPSGASPLQFVQFGDLIFPWDGATKPILV